MNERYVGIIWQTSRASSETFLNEGWRATQQLDKSAMMFASSPRTARALHVSARVFFILIKFFVANENRTLLFFSTAALSVILSTEMQ